MTNLRVRLLILGIFALLSSTQVLAQSGDLVIGTPSSGVAGGVMCFTVLGSNGNALSVSVEVNGICLPSSQVQITAPDENGAVQICVRIPSGASGASVSVTATTSTASGSASGTVH